MDPRDRWELAPQCLLQQSQGARALASQADKQGESSWQTQRQASRQEEAEQG